MNVLSVLELVNSVCYELNLPPTSTVVLTSDPAIQQLSYLMMSVGRDLRQAKCWPQLKRTHSFTGTGNQDYDLPDDFYASTIDTAWDVTNQWKMIGPMTDSAWNEILYGYASWSNQKFYRVFGRLDTLQTQIYPAPPVGDTITFDYISANWVFNTVTSVWSDHFTDDANVTAFDDDLMILGTKAKWCQVKALSPADQYMEEYQSKIAQAQARWQGNKKVRMSPYSNNYYGWPNIPIGNYTL